MGFFDKLFRRATSETTQTQRPYQIGDRVRVKNDGPGAAKPAETGHPEEVIIEQKGLEGTIISFNSKGIPIVRWDGGTYRVLRGRQDAPTGATVVWYKGTVHLDAFEHGINADWIEPNVPSVNPSQPERTTSSGRRYIHQSVSDGDTSMFECERCHKAGSHRRTTDQYAGDLWLCPSCGYKTGRYDKL